jgi:parvulin-like peptidyl-prolyl isomerase
MARRERTTALPRARQRADTVQRGRRPLGERTLQLGIIGVAALLLLAVLGVFAYQVYRDRVLVPASAVLRVGDEKFSLRYYADRLGPYIQTNSGSGSSLAILEENLLTKLEEEALTLILAREAGIDLSDEALTEFIAGQFGVPVGGSGSSYDSLYRNQLRTLGMSDGAYRRMKRAEMADARLEELVRAGLPAEGEQYTLRVVLVNDEETAASLRRRIEAGEDMGTIAQLESLDLQSRQNDGIVPPEPIDLMPEDVRDVVREAEVGALLGPLKVANTWWVFRVESVETRAFTDAQLQQLATVEFNRRLAEKRTELAGKIRRSLSADDIKWAEEHARLSGG